VSANGGIPGLVEKARFSERSQSPKTCQLQIEKHPPPKKTPIVGGFSFAAQGDQTDQPPWYRSAKMVMSSA